ncbi:hypothetical protein ACX12M_17155 [Cellulosimicrobium cellulans]
MARTAPTPDPQPADGQTPTPGAAAAQPAAVAAQEAAPEQPPTQNQRRVARVEGALVRYGAVEYSIADAVELGLIPPQDAPGPVL